MIRYLFCCAFFFDQHFMFRHLQSVDVDKLLTAERFGGEAKTEFKREYSSGFLA
jgi:hypothetical protein